MAHLFLLVTGGEHAAVHKPAMPQKGAWYLDVRALVIEYWPRYSEDTVVRYQCLVDCSRTMPERCALPCSQNPLLCMQIYFSGTERLVDCDRSTFKGMFVYVSESAGGHEDCLGWGAVTRAIIKITILRLKSLELRTPPIMKKISR